ncbi:hypothetical protein B5G28_11585 [Faecalibacterium sp. An77]|uniref:bacteriophage T4 gp5 trimerisation domain-containing protein n=1 Tax=Faecalibacterium sp. An77 TaxID=1965655 RepID=UPI000B3A8FAE|nr:hypothetical protein [Faecalibacterium sp. An77]OUN36737.1 hypothetical protein B5G28_11585 [Faecalibacterium sp. An77]
MSAEIRVGKVSSIDYPSGMVRVTYPDMDDDVTRLIPLFSSEYAMPPVGALVAVVHLSNGAEAGVVLGRPWSAKLTPPEGFEGLYRKDFDLTPWKCYIRYDANVPESLYHTEGDDYQEIVGKQETLVKKDRKDTTEGSYQEAVTQNSTTEIGGDRIQTVQGSRTSTVQGDDGVTVTGKRTLQVGGDAAATVQGSQTTIVKGDATITVSGKLTLQVGGCTVQIDGSSVSVTAASAVSLNAPTLSLEGTTVQISGATVNITGGAGDCAIMGKSLVNHTHTCAAPGSPTTPPL